MCVCVYSICGIDKDTNLATFSVCLLLSMTLTWSCDSCHSAVCTHEKIH